MPQTKVLKSKVGSNWGSDFEMEIIGPYGYDFEYNLVTSAQNNGLVSKGGYPKYMTSMVKNINLVPLLTWFNS